MGQAQEKRLWIEPAQEGQMDQIMELYKRARQFMAAHGNPNQWPPDYPSEEIVRTDIRKGHMFVCMEEKGIAAVFYYRKGEDPDYRKIWEGAWLNDKPYGVVHRIASSGTGKGVGSFCLKWALEQCGNLRIDTHRDNVVMQHLLKKNGFQYCGIIHARDGGERLAYEKETLKEKK